MNPGDELTTVISHNELAIRRFRLRVTAGPDLGLEHTSTGDEISIGTSPANTLILSDKSVSRHHCAVVTARDGVMVRDLGSTNGTFVDRVRVQAAYLRSGATLAVGSTQLRVDLLDETLYEPLSQAESMGRVLGASAAMRRIFAVIERVAASQSTILLEGETGTGKTLIAEIIHQHSQRAGAPFVVVDCGAIPPSLIESELFGHEKGSFTGAHAARPGAFESALGGTVFLDEIGELPLDLQPKLLRVLEDRVIKRIGAAEPIRLDIRLIAATNRELREEVNRGNFRSDLYYRLNTVRLRVPPLRERPDDIPLLVAHFYRQFGPDEDAHPPLELIQTCLRHPWPGNVRELRSAVERAVLLGEYRSMDDADGAALPAGSPFGSFDVETSYQETKRRMVQRFEHWYVTELIRRHDGNLSQAARAARMDRNHLRELLRRHGIAVRTQPE